MDNMEKKLDLILNTIVGLMEEFIDFKTETNNRLHRVEAILLRIEEGQPDDVTVMLKQIKHKDEEHDSEIQALNKRVFQVESKLERLTQ